eukprot:Gb_01007 [translate_table: standard]
MGFWHLLSMATLMSCLSNLSSLGVLKQQEEELWVFSWNFGAVAEGRLCWLLELGRTVLHWSLWRSDSPWSIPHCKFGERAEFFLLVGFSTLYFLLSDIVMNL